jgi:hypothetical protein
MTEPTWHRNPRQHLKRHANRGLLIALAPGATITLIVCYLLRFGWAWPWQ